MLLKINANEILDALKINFDTNSLWALNVTLAIIMFGVALGITIEDFKRLFKNPKIVLVGITSQFIFDNSYYILENWIISVGQTNVKSKG